MGSFVSVLKGFPGKLSGEVRVSERGKKVAKLF